MTLCIAWIRQAGEIYQAYPLILNLISTIKHNEKLQDPKLDIQIEAFNGTDDHDFLKSCYYQEDNFLKQDISDNEREKLIVIFREHAYQEFLKVAEENQ